MDLTLGRGEPGGDSEAESALFALDLTLGRGLPGGDTEAESRLFAVDLRGVIGPSLGLQSAESARFSVNLRGEAGGLEVSGVVLDRDRGVVLSGVTVQIGSRTGTSDALGQYRIVDVPTGPQPLRAVLAGYDPFEATITVPAGSTVVRNIDLHRAAAGTLRVTRINAPYDGFLHFLENARRRLVPIPIDFVVPFTANVDWAGHPPGTVRFITPRKTYVVSTAGTSATQAINVTDDLGAGHRLSVVAVSGDGTQSSATRADFVTMRSPIPGLASVMGVSEQGGTYEYHAEAGVETKFLEEIAVQEGAVPGSFPIFGGHALRLDFIPSVEAVIGANGRAEFDLRWDNLEAMKALDREWGREHNARKIGALLSDFLANGRVDRRRLPRAGVAGAEVLFYPIFKHELQHDDANGDWDWASSSFGFAGYGKIEKSWPFILMAGPIPVPMYGKVMVELEATAMGRLLSIEPVEAELTFKLEPYARGSLGAGVDQVLAVEGWIGGGAEANFRFPQTPHVESAQFYLNGGVRVYAFLFHWETELLRWAWPEQAGLLAKGLLSPGFTQVKHGPVPRDYLALPNYRKWEGSNPGRTGGKDD